MMMKKNLVKVVKVCAVGCSLFVASGAFGGDITWTGNGNDGIWSTGANWSNNSGPGTGDSAVFNSSGGTITVNVTANYQMQNIRVLGSADVVVNIADGVVLSCSNSGSLGIQANGADLTINGPGKLAMSSTGSGINHLDNGASLGRTLAIHAEIIGINGGLTGFETWLASTATRGGDVILGYTANAFTLDMNANMHTIIVSKLAPAGQPSCLGAINNIMPARGGTIRYIGTGDTAGYAFRLSGGDANLGYGGGIAQDGTGPLLWTGNIYNENNNVQTLTLSGDSASPGTITGNIYNNQGTLAVVKNGSGTWVLAGDNSYTGGLTVNDGTLGLDSTNAHGNVSQITMAPGAALALNPSDAASFTATLPPINASGTVALSVGGASSAVTLSGLNGGIFAVTTSDPGTLVFISGLNTGPVGPWLTLNGAPAQYDPTNGLTPLSLTTQSIKTKGDTLPDGADIAAVIDTIGTGGPITLTADPTTLHSLTLTAPDGATVATATKTLMAGEVANASAANVLTIGVTPQDGLLLPPLQFTPPVIPDSSAVAALDPVIWYDPSETANVGLYLGTVTNLVNKGSGGPALNAVVRPGFTAPLYATGVDSDTPLPMVKIAVNGQGLESATNTGVAGNNPRTLIAVMSRGATNPGLELTMGAPTANLWFSILHYSDGGTRFSIFGTDNNMTGQPNNVPTVMSMLNGVGGNLASWQGFQDKTPSSILTSSSMNTTDTPLCMGYRSNGSSNSQRGQFGEILLFNKSLTDIERQIVEDYLIAKWKQPKPVTQSATLTLRSDNAAPLTVNAALAEPSGGVVSLAKAGPGDVTLAGGTTLSGIVLIDDGALTLDTPPGLTDTLSGVTLGAGKLIKAGDGTLSLPPSIANQYAGGTDILGGILGIGNSSSLGTGPVAISGGGTLDIGGGTAAGSITLTNPITVSGAGAGGLGAIVNNGPVTQRNAFSNTIRLTDDATIGGTFADRWDIAGASAFLDLNGHTLTKTGVTDFRISPANITNAPAGVAFDIQQGTLGVETSSTFHPNDNLREIHIADGGRFGVYNLATPLNWPITAADGAEIWSYGTDSATNRNVITGDITVNGTLHLTASGSFAKNLTGQLSGTGGLSVHDGGENAMSLLSHPDNLFQGPVAVSNATLALRYPGSYPGGLPSLLSTLSLASNTATGLRVFAGADGWSDPEILQLVTSGLLNSTNHRFGIIVGPDDTASLPALGTVPAATIDKYGPGTLSLDGDIGPRPSNIRVYGGSLLFTNNTTVALGTFPLLLKDGNDFDSQNRDVYALVGGNTAITSTDLGYNQANGPYVSVGHNAGKVILDLTDDALIQAKLMVGNNNANAVGALYQSGGTFLSTGGANNDARIGYNGYGYYQLDDGDLIMKGYTQLGAVNNNTSIGILRQMGGAITFNGMRDPIPADKTVTDSYGGQLGLSRGGKAVLHLQGGTFDHYGPLAIIDASGTYAAATMTVTGNADVMVDRNLTMGNGNTGLASLNLNGGTLAAPQILRKDVTGSRAIVNFNGGLLRVADTPMLGGSLLAREGNTPAAFNAYVYPGGARIEIADGFTRTVDIPLEQPADSGIASIAVTGGGSGYIAPPYVTIAGGDNNATAIATINRATGQLTGIEITNPGTRYNTPLPTVTFTGGGGTGATVGAITRTGNSGGGLTKTGGGTLILNAPNTYTGPTVVEEGTLMLAHPDAIHPQSEVIIRDGILDLGGNTITNRSLTITGSGGIANGKVITSSAVKTGPATATWDAEIEFAAVGEPPIPGLWEGHVKGSSGAYWDFTTPNPKDSVQLSARAGDVPFGSSDSAPRAEFWGSPRDYNMWIYTGYLWNRADTNVTWTWRFRFDDNVSLMIDGILLRNGNSNAAYTTYTLTPGPHPIEIRFGDGTGSVGDNTSNGGGLMYDPLGRGSSDFANYIHLQDDGSGDLLTVNLPPPEPDTAVRVLGGTLQMPPPSGRDPGLWEGGIKGTSSVWWNLTTPNPSTSVQFTTRAGNVPLGPNNTSPRDEFWNGNQWTWIYTGYLWNRSGTNETWSWRAGFDDRVRLTIDGNHLITTDGAGVFAIVNYLLTPGPHPIEIRFADNTGNVGPVSSWPSGVMYDRLGRESASAADYLVLVDDGTGFLLTTTLRDNVPADLSDVVFDVADGAALDLDNTSRDGMIISPAGDNRTGTMSIDGLFNGSLNGVTYNLTIRDPVAPATPPVPGLWEGHHKGIVGAYWDFGFPNPKESVQLTTRAGNLPFGVNSDAARAEFWNGNYNMWIYSGYVWNRTSADVKWTWRFRFDDNVSLMIDGVLLRDGNSTASYLDHTLTPGPHAIEIRFGDGTGSVGDNTTNGGGLMYDPLGRGSTDFANYIHLQDDGSGSLLTTTIAGTPGDTQTCDVITATGILNLNGLTIKPSDLPSATPPGKSYVIATADGFTGVPVLDGFLKAWAIRKVGTELLLTKPGTMLILR